MSKKIIVYFFCALISVFLNISSHAQQDGGSKEFIPPLIIADYDSGTLITTVKSLSGGDEEKPGICFATVSTDDDFTRGNSGYSLLLDYDVSNSNEYSFYWMKLGKDVGGKSDVTEYLDLKKFNYLSFWVKGAQDEGNIRIELHQDTDQDNMFRFGKDITSHVYANTYLKKGVMGREWQKVIIPLKDFARITDRSKMIELVFVFENRAGSKTGLVYIDEVLFGYRPEEVLLAQEVKEIKAPLESSFKANGLKAKQCPAFNGSNNLEIKAEDIYGNPFIESVRFEYSTDKGNVWRTVGVDYDVGKNTYKAAWNPDNSRQLISYQVRAVASDVRGNEKATGVLIDCGVKPMTDDEFLNLIEKAAFEFFNDHQNPKTGLFADTSGGGDASIASTGFGLAALCVGVKRGWIDKETARKRVILALNSFLPREDSEESLAQGRYGFFYHFLNMNTGKRAGKSEISTVDTAILVCGAITAGEYFGGEVKAKSEELYKRVDWSQFLCKKEGPWYNLFSMGWSPERGFLESYWDYYTDEVILINLLAIGSPTYPVLPDVFYVWTRHEGAYAEGKPFIYTWHGSLFSYQYANVWFNFQNLADKNGINWFENSTNATLANRQFCIDNSDKFKGYGPNSWGVTSMDRPQGYTMHFGAPPTGSGESQHDGTISPTGPSGSIVFTPYLSISALKYMYITYPRFWGHYGFRDSFNFDSNWYSPTYYGIGEAMYLLPIENFRSGFIWENFMKNKYIKESLVKAGFTSMNPVRKTSFSNGVKKRR